MLRAVEASPAAGGPMWDSGAQALDGRGFGAPVQRGSSDEEGLAGPVRIGAEREALYKMYSEHIEACGDRKFTRLPQFLCLQGIDVSAGAAPREASCLTCRSMTNLCTGRIATPTLQQY